MLKFLSNLFDDNKKTINRYQETVSKINDLEPQIKKLTDSKLAAQTQKFKKIIAEQQQRGKSDEEILTQLLPEAFATVRETSNRVLGLRHFDVQLIAGIALHHSAVT